MKYKTKKLPVIKDIKNIFFVGIKGAGTMPLSLIAKEAGMEVAGSDIDEQFITDKYLKSSGIKVFKDFNQNDIHDFFRDKDPQKSLVVTTGAHRGFDNPQVVWARQNGFEVVTQGQALGLFTDGAIFGRSFKSIAVAASHGKTTISSLLVTVLKNLGDDSSYTVGTGEIFPNGAPGHYGEGEFFVAEADEYASEPVYDRIPKFLYINPNYAIFNNIDFDHPDLFEGIEDVKDAFVEFAHNIKSGGILVVNGDDSNLKNIKNEVDKDIRVIFYGEGSQNDYQISKIVTFGMESKFTVTKRGTEVGVFELMIPGVHNAKNALGVISLLLELGYDKSMIRSALSVFTGTKRRLERLGTTSGGAIVYDDYGHHPQEIRATLKALKDSFPDKKIICVFQPHTFSRTKALLSDFSVSFSSTYKLILVPIFRSQRDTEKDTMNEDEVFQIFKEKVDASFFPEFEDVVEYLDQNFDSDEYILLTIGAGDVYKIAQDLVKG